MMKQKHHGRAHCLFSGCGRLCAALLLVLFLPSCGGSGVSDTQEPPDRKAERNKVEPATRPPGQAKEGETKDSPAYEGRQRDGATLEVADPLKAELVGALPPEFPDDIPLGNWMTITSVRRLGETDFVLSCSTSHLRGAVGEFFVRHMPERGWKLVSRSSKPILSVFTFRNDQRAVTVMVKKQAMNEDVDFDISYKQN